MSRTIVYFLRSSAAALLIEALAACQLAGAPSATPLPATADGAPTTSALALPTAAPLASAVSAPPTSAPATSTAVRSATTVGAAPTPIEETAPDQAIKAALLAQYPGGVDLVWDAAARHGGLRRGAGLARARSRTRRRHGANRPVAEYQISVADHTATPRVICPGLTGHSSRLAWDTASRQRDGARASVDADPIRRAARVSGIKMTNTNEVNKMYTTQLLDNRDRAHLDQAAELLMQGEIIPFGFNGIFAFIGDADQAIAARRIGAAKQQPFDKPVALVCAPEHLTEFIDLEAPAFHYHAFAKLQQLQREVYNLGVLLPAARSGVPSYMTHNGTILNVLRRSTRYPK